MRLRMEQFIKSKQTEIITALQAIDGKQFRIDTWERPGHGGGGISCVLQEGNVFEKAGVNISIVYGKLPRPAILKMRANHKNLDTDVESLDFFAAGLSMVLHPHNPMAPTVHLNYRYFETMRPDGTTQSWWFGGGTDLTPSYLFDEDAIHFHKTIKDVCDKHDKDYYPKFKKWCDEYFYIPHRKESRGIGGLFFDDLNSGPHLRFPSSEPEVGRPKTPAEIFELFKELGNAFLPSYMPILEIRKSLPYTPQQRRWQLIRRGRYVEFNLVYDRGTKFGLNTPGARIESILMSLPEAARWEYMSELGEEGTEEGKLVAVLKKPKEWI